MEHVVEATDEISFDNGFHLDPTSNQALPDSFADWTMALQNCSCLELTTDRWLSLVIA